MVVAMAMLDLRKEMLALAMGQVKLFVAVSGMAEVKSRVNGAAITFSRATM